MHEMRYESPKTAGGGGCPARGRERAGESAGRRHGSADPDARRPRRARVAGRHQGHPGDDLDRRRKTARIVSAPPFRCMVLVENKAFAQGMARRDRQREADRIDPGEGTRDRGRQSVQRLAGRGQRSRPDRRRCDRAASSGPRAGARCRSRRSPPDRARRRSPRARSSRRSCCRSARRVRAMRICASSRAPRWISRSSARASISRWTTRACAPRRGSAIGAVAERALLVPEAAAALIGTKVDADALEAHGRRRERGLPADRRQARNQGIPDQGCRRDGAARR